MSPDETNDDRAAVLAVVQAYFGDGEFEADELLFGPLLEWTTLMGELPWADRFELRRTLTDASILELSETHAVVDVRADVMYHVVRGSTAHRFDYGGPAALRKVEGRWRLVDHMLDGRRQLQSIVVGLLAEQTNGAVTVRVLAMNRQADATSWVVEVSNAGTRPVRVARGYALFEASTAWASLSVDKRSLIEPGESGTRVLVAGHAVALSETLFAIALQVRSGSRRLPFRLTVPLTPPLPLVPQRAPQWLPVMRTTWPRSLVFYGVLTVAAAWWYSWLAIVVPIYVAVAVYRSIRRSGSLPGWLYPARYVVDAAVAFAAFLILWLTPAVVLAVPAAVAVLVYAALMPLGRRREEVRLVLALSIGAGWLFLFGLNDGPFSPCRIADGRPAAAADEFARAFLVGDFDRAARLRASGSDDPAESNVRPVSAAVAVAAVEARTAAPWCRSLRSELANTRCYWYENETDGEVDPSLVVSIGCHDRRWLVDWWFAPPSR